MPGRKAKPTRLRVLEGNPGKRPINQEEPEAELGIPRKPSWLAARASEFWDEIVPVLTDLGVLTKADGQALALLCQVHANWRRKQSPALTLRLQSLMAEFGLTPSSRTRIRTNPKGKKSPLEEFLGRGTKSA